MKRAQRHSLIEQVTASLRAEISTGRWPVGSKIPTEPALMELTGTGRNTVREAVQALVHAGLLQRRQGSGTYVLAHTDEPAAIGRLLSRAERRDLMELRLALEVSAARLAATRRTAQDCAALADALARRYQAQLGADASAEMTADLDLHQAVMAASHNAIFIEVYASLLPMTSALVAQAISVDVHGDAEHADLVEAIIDSDVERAGASAQRILDVMLGL